VSFAEFIHMGGYAGYVWGSYGLGLLIFVLVGWSARRNYIEALASARRKLQAAATSKT